MRIGHRLLLAVAPGLIGVIAVASLAYWGERNRQIPGTILIIVAIATALSLWFAWVTTRDLARRIERFSRLAEPKMADAPHEHSLLIGLAREALSRLSGSGRAGRDELDPVEQLVVRFDVELARHDAARRAAEDRVAQMRAEAARLLHDAGDRIARSMDEVRLPLHVLLDTPFGALNENQEEMIGSARVAADAASEEARRIRDLGTLELSSGGRRDRVPANDLLRSLIPLIESEAIRARARVNWNVEPALPAIVGDRSRLQEVLREIAARVVRAAEQESTLNISAAKAATDIVVRIEPVRHISIDDLLVERRVLEALGARLSIEHGRGSVVLPTWSQG